MEARRSRSQTALGGDPEDRSNVESGVVLRRWWGRKREEGQRRRRWAWLKDKSRQSRKKRRGGGAGKEVEVSGLSVDIVSEGQGSIVWLRWL